MTHSEELSETYSQCEKSIDDLWKRASGNMSKLPNPLAIKQEAAYMRALAVQYLYENVRLRDTANTAEMHALHDRLAGMEVKRMTVHEINAALNNPLKP